MSEDPRQTPGQGGPDYIDPRRADFVWAVGASARLLELEAAIHEARRELAAERLAAGLDSEAEPRLMVMVEFPEGSPIRPFCAAAGNLEPIVTAEGKPTNLLRLRVVGPPLGIPPGQDPQSAN